MMQPGSISHMVLDDLVRVGVQKFVPCPASLAFFQTIINEVRVCGTKLSD